MLDGDLKADSTLCEGEREGRKKVGRLGGSILDCSAVLKFSKAVRKSQARDFIRKVLHPTWMDLENTMLSEISQRKTNTLCYHLYVESKKLKVMNITKQEKSLASLALNRLWEA